MTGSSLVLSWLIVHAGVMRRSDEELSETTIIGTSAMVSDMATSGERRIRPVL